MEGNNQLKKFTKYCFEKAGREIWQKATAMNFIQHGSFTTNSKAWIPVNPNYWRINVEKQQSQPRSTYNYLKDLLKLKKTKTIINGDLNKYILSDWVFAFQRSYDGFEVYIVVINLGTEKTVVSLKSNIRPLPDVLKICLASNNFGMKKGKEIYLKKRQTFIMRPMSVVVLCQEHEVKPNDYCNENGCRFKQIQPK